MKVKEVLNIIYEEEYYSIYDDDSTRILLTEKVENAKENGCKYGEWEVIDIEIGIINNPTHGQMHVIMINCYNPKEAN